MVVLKGSVDYEMRTDISMEEMIEDWTVLVLEGSCICISVVDTDIGVVLRTVLAAVLRGNKLVLLASGVESGAPRPPPIDVFTSNKARPCTQQAIRSIHDYVLSVVSSIRTHSVSSTNSKSHYTKCAQTQATKKTAPVI